MAAPAKFTEYIDANADKFIQRLADAVAIPSQLALSISGDASHRTDVVKMAHFLDDQLKALGVETSLVDLGMHGMDGHHLQLPPAILGKIGNDPAKKTILVYGHYDVQPAEKSDGWNTDPFTLVVEELTGKLIGRGSTDDKGPVLGWLNVLQAHRASHLDLPVNLRICFEGMEESGSEGLDDLITSEVAKGKEGWFHGVDCVCISDNYWLNTRTPALTYGLRGLAYYKLTVSGPAQDLHSGVFGRTIHEPLTDLLYLLSSLVAPSGDILIPGIDEVVPPPDDAERQRYATLDYGIADVESAAGGVVALSDIKDQVLMGRMRMPSLSVHGIEGAFSGVGAKTVIPAKVAGKFSIRLVPPLTPDYTTPLVLTHLTQKHAQLNTKSKMHLESLHGGLPWLTDPTHPNFTAARRATVAVYGREPDLTREGGSIPVTLSFAEALKCSVVLIPMGRGDDGAHSTNEKLDRSNFIQGTKLLGTYLYEVAAIAKEGGWHD